MGQWFWIFLNYIQKTRKLKNACVLTLKSPTTTTADDILIFSYFSMKTSLDFSCESSAWQTFRMNSQDLFSLKNNKKYRT